jgi:hypothetical protein
MDCWNCKGEGCFICEDRHDDYVERERLAAEQEVEEDDGDI